MEQSDRLRGCAALPARAQQPPYRPEAGRYDPAQETNVAITMPPCAWPLRTGPAAAIGTVALPRVAVDARAGPFLAPQCGRRLGAHAAAVACLSMPAATSCARRWPANRALVGALPAGHGIRVRAGPPQPAAWWCWPTADGMLMHTLGDAVLRGQSRARGARQRRHRGHEAQRGAPTRSARRWPERSAWIRGSEHFLERNGFLTCAASPIPSATGELTRHPGSSRRPPQRPRPHLGPGEHRSAHDREPPVWWPPCKRNSPPAACTRSPKASAAWLKGIIALVG